VVIAASSWGKYKTIFQMAMIIVLIANLGGIFHCIGAVLIWMSLILTIISLIDYIYKNRSVLMEK
jgi:CDP-diacylglycerol--glycerol-3-phosphate 3-phosphatidyltransferase